MLKLKKRKGSPNWYACGSHLGIDVEQSLRTRDRGEAERLLAKLQSEIFERHLRGGSSPDAEGFASAALRYMESGGERRYVAPLLVHFGDLPIDQLDQQTIDMAAAALYPNCGPERRVLNDGPLRKFGAIPDLAPISARPRPSHLRPMQPST